MKIKTSFGPIFKGNLQYDLKFTLAINATFVKFQMEHPLGGKIRSRETTKPETERCV